MTDIHFNDGTAVITSDDNVFGTVQGVSGEEVLVEHDGRVVHVHRSLFDEDRSTHDRLVLLDKFRAPLNEPETTGTTIPLHAEELSVRTTEKDLGKLRIQKSVEHFPVQEDVELGTDVVEVERVPSDEEFDEMPRQWQDGDTLVIPVVEEVLVLTRRYRVVENVRVTRRREVRTERIEADLQREVVTFTQEDAEGNPLE